MAVIICADNDQATRNFYHITLSQSDYETTIAGTAAELDEALKQHWPNLVIVNTNFAGREINKLIGYLTNTQTKLRPIVIVVSDDQNQEKILNCISSGADDYLTKPFTAFDLITKISVALKKVQSQAVEEHSEPSILRQSRYKIIAHIGDGTYGSVYRAVDQETSSQDEVALKIFNSSAYEGLASSLNTFFLREAYAMSTMDHTNLVKCIDFGKADGTFFLVMEFAEGDTLHDMVCEKGPLEEPALAQIGFQLAGMLKYLGSHNVVHRDIKPGNIIISECGDPKVADFGLTKQKDDMSLTLRHSRFMGTPNFVAPEQIKGQRNVDVRCDVYSLGTTLYFSGTGKLPFASTSALKTLQTNLKEPLTPMDEINSNISAEFAQLISRMTEKEKEERIGPTELEEQFAVFCD